MNDLYDRDESARFYEQRYAHSYMEDWPAEKKRRIAEVVQALPLPASGQALDFGCGNGVFTEVLRQSLPSWRVVGTNFSGQALANAAARYPGCRYLAASSLPREG